MKHKPPTILKEGEPYRHKKEPDFSFVFTGIYYDPNRKKKKVEAYKRYDERRKGRKRLKDVVS